MLCIILRERWGCIGGFLPAWHDIQKATVNVGVESKGVGEIAETVWKSSRNSSSDEFGSLGSNQNGRALCSDMVVLGTLHYL